MTITLSIVPTGVVSSDGANSGLAIGPRSISLVLLVFSSMLFSNDHAMSRNAAMLEVYDYSASQRDSAASEIKLSSLNRNNLYSIVYRLLKLAKETHMRQITMGPPLVLQNLCAERNILSFRIPGLR